MKKIIMTLALLFIVLSITYTSNSYSIPSIKEWLAEVSKPYKGVTIRWITESTTPSLFIRDVLAPEFEEITGIKVEVEATSWDEMYRKSIADMEAGTGIYDLVYVEQDIIAFYAAKGYLTDIREFPERLWYPDYDIEDIFSLKYYIVDDKVLAVPFETFIKTYVYRKDLFNDPDERAAFKEKYGWELRPPKTWKEYAQIAEFFYRPEQGLYGHVAQAGTHPALWYEVVAETIFPTFGVHYWGITLARRASVEEGGAVNSRAAIAALTMYIDLLKYAPPGVKTYTWDEVGAAWVAGLPAQGLVYGDQLAKVIDPEISKVAGKIDVALPPVEPKYYKGGYVGYMDMGGFGIPHSSRNKEAAWLFIQWVTSKENAERMMRELGTSCTRRSLLFGPVADEIDEKYGFHYFEVMRKGVTMGLFEGAPPLPEHAIIVDLGYKILAKAIAGEVTPEECLNELAKAIDQKFIELGYTEDP